MNSHQQAHEAYVQFLIGQRHVDAIKAEQVRMARDGRPRRLPDFISKIRVSIGTALISTGERVRHEPIQSTDTPVLTRTISGTT